MKATRKNSLSYAVGAVLAAMAVVPMSASAVSVDVNAGAFESDDGADALAYPIYSTANGVTTSFSLTNTSDRAIAVKVRFREQQRSMDVWDTIVFLSPFDKWDFSVSASPGDRTTPQVTPAGDRAKPDSTCTTAPSYPSAFRQTAFNSVGWADGRATVGHMEVIGMMDLTNASIKPNAVVDPVSIGALIEERGCAALRTIFTNPILTQTVEGAVDVENVLIGRYVVGVNGGGLEAGDVPVALRNTFADPIRLAQSPSARCNTPTVDNNGNCMSTYAWDQFEEDHPHLGDIVEGNFQNIDRLMTADNLQGDWSSNPANYVGTDWIASFFAKYVYTDWANCDGAPGNEWCDVLPLLKPSIDPAVRLAPVAYVPNNPWNSALVAPGTLSRPASCLTISLWGWDIDEIWDTGGVSPNVPPRLCNEVTVIGISADAASARPSIIQQNTGPFARPVFEFADLADLGATRGWADLLLDWPVNTTGDAVTGGAVSASLFMTRSEPSNPAASNASLVPLAHRFSVE